LSDKGPKGPLLCAAR